MCIGLNKAFDNMLWFETLLRMLVHYVPIYEKNVFSIRIEGLSQFVTDTYR